MTPSFKELRKQVGGALWLLSVLCQSTPDGWNGVDRVLIAGGVLISDAQLAEFLGVTLATISRWRGKLRRVGVLDWLVKPGAGRVFIVHSLREPTPTASAPADAASQQTVSTEVGQALEGDLKGLRWLN